MEAPEFEEVAPDPACACAGCLATRIPPRASRGGALARPAVVRTVVAATATPLAVAGAGQAAALPADDAPSAAPQVEAIEPGETPQGPRAPLHGVDPDVTPMWAVDTPPTTRDRIIERARTWVSARVPYSMSRYWYDGYRQDCSGYVSMAWGLTGNEWTGSLHHFGERITKDELLPGDILLFHNPANPSSGSHVVIFAGWTDDTREAYLAYEQTPPHAVGRVTPYAYWRNSSGYVPYRYNGLVEEGPTGEGLKGPLRAASRAEAGAP
ncbi:NlpC/P60 family protein [Streptomyces sp. ZYX-F-203]